MTTMVERVRKATAHWSIVADGDGLRVADGIVIHGCIYRDRSDALEAMDLMRARAAIAAMREPTEPMIDRFVSRALCVSVSGEGGWSEYGRGQWQTMIDAALNEEPEA